MTTSVVSPEQLTECQTSRMYELMAAHYDGVRKDTFLEDLAEKSCVILLEEEEGIIGFSTQKLIEYEGVRAVFSGDTIIHRDHWGTQRLSRAFARCFFDHPDGPLYWFLISKGYKTYKYLPTFFKEFYPRHDQPTPPGMQTLLDGYGRLLYPGEYNPSTGVIEYKGEKDRLKEELQDLSERAGDPHYRFFARMNPEHREGHDLACITRLSRDNLRRGAERILFGNTP